MSSPDTFKKLLKHKTKMIENYWCWEKMSGPACLCCMEHLFLTWSQCPNDSIISFCCL